jgi:hypothetical protein
MLLQAAGRALLPQQLALLLLLPQLVLGTQQKPQLQEKKLKLNPTQTAKQSPQQPTQLAAAALTAQGILANLTKLKTVTLHSQVQRVQQ